MKEHRWSNSRRRRVFSDRVKANVGRLLDVSRQDLSVADYDKFVQRVTREVAIEAVSIFESLEDYVTKLPPVSNEEIFDRADDYVSQRSSG